MKKLVSFILVACPLVVMSQDASISGLWKLNKKRSFSGPDYNNGIPKVIKVQQDTRHISFEFVNEYKDKDTVEAETLVVGLNATNENTTPSKRRKKVTFNRDEEQGSWVRKTVLSAKNNPNQTEITIVDVIKRSGNGHDLILHRTYDGSDSGGGNADYVMEGTYESVTPEELARDTATGKGVIFLKGLTWAQILDKAQKEHKMIFVDCYATWCLPCKKMDKEVFPLNVIGEAMAGKYISVKVQMDTGKRDDKYAKMTYPLARKFEKSYNIAALPTYLFFDPDGNIVHKEIGVSTMKSFLKLILDASDTAKQIYTLAHKAKRGQLSYSQVPELAALLASRKYSEKELARDIARKYLEDHLYKMNMVGFFNRKNVDFINSFKNVIESRDRMFRIFLDSSATVDSLVGMPRFASKVIESVIVTEEMTPVLKKAKETGTMPHWDAIEGRISKKYGKSYSNSVVINSKLVWFKQKKEWKDYCQNLMLQMDMMGDLSKVSWITLNSAAWDMFKYSSDRIQLEKALVWSDAAIKNQIASKEEAAPFTSILDTYANLLYKLDRKDEAIKFYQDKIIGAGLQYYKFYETYVKMNKNLPTWEN